MRQREIQNGLTLPEIALNVRMTRDGSYDGMTAEDYARWVKALEQALSTWTPSRAGYEKFDNAVKEMVESALEFPEPSYLKEWREAVKTGEGA